ncbi:MAG: acyltransferase [Eubacterium sp.]|nr:acyltransferase [Eubacterium sp.]
MEEGFDSRRIGVLDGVRVLAIGIVVWYHYWEATWLSPRIGSFDITNFPKFGYLMVEMMILLSGFLLALPYAREAAYGERTGGVRRFYVNRFARIAPCYYLIVLVIFFAIALPSGQYGGSGADALKDFVPHIFFVHNLFPASFISTHLDGALWTLAVLMQLYLIFPFVIRWFQKHPVPTYLVMIGISFASTWIILGINGITEDWPWLWMLSKNTFSYLAVYANGMLGAFAYVQITKNRKRTPYGQILATILAIACVPAYKMICDVLGSGVQEEVWLLENRYLLSVFFLVFVLAVIFSVKWFRFLFDNRVMHWLAGISFNMYMVHQYVAERLGILDIPHMTGATPEECGAAWQWTRLGLCLAISFPLAVALTYLVERPCARWIHKKLDGRMPAGVSQDKKKEKEDEKDKGES